MPDQAEDIRSWPGKEVLRLRFDLGRIENPTANKPISRERLAQLVGTTQNTVVRWESEKSRPMPIFIGALTRLRRQVDQMLEDAETGAADDSTASTTEF